MPEAEAPEVDAPEDAPNTIARNARLGRVAAAGLDEDGVDDGDDGAGSKRAVLRDLARTRAEKKDIERQLAELRESSMSDQEKAIATAKAEARREALATVNMERVRDKVEAAAGARSPFPR
jgi:histone acetyltransferase (RNA polymerase elongator complex component)